MKQLALTTLGILVFHLSIGQITDTGDKVGIGTTNPSVKFHLRKDVGTAVGPGYVADANMSGQWLSNLSTNPSAGAAISFQLGGTGTSFAAIAASRPAADQSAIHFFTEHGNSIEERARISSNGNVGIGTIAPNARLDVKNTSPLSALNIEGRSTQGNQVFIEGSDIGGKVFSLSDGNGQNTAGGLVFTGFRRSDNPGLYVVGKQVVGNGLGQASQEGTIDFRSYTYESNDFQVLSSPHDNHPAYKFNANDLDLATITYGGNVGIGTNNPDSKVTIQGNLNVGGTANGTIKARHLTGKSHVDSGYGDLYLNYHTTHPVRVGTSVNKAPLLVSGNVGIGTNTPSEKLEVNGTIRSKEVKVEANGWPDYVFEEDYPLSSLEEIEAFIKSNKHLPEIPSAKEMEANGVQLGEMNMLLLKKIEELTLYTIEQEKKLVKQNKEMESYEQSIADLKQQLEAQTSELETFKEEILNRIEQLEGKK